MQARLYLSILLAALVRWNAGVAEDTCLDCHADPDIARETTYKEGTSVFVDRTPLHSSVHADLDCIDCHADASDDHAERLQVAACADCHEEAVDAYAGSLHGVALARGVADAPTCADCHGEHDILAAADSASTVQARQIPYTCGACHADVDFIERRPLAIGKPLKHYESAIPGEGCSLSVIVPSNSSTPSRA